MDFLIINHRRFLTDIDFYFLAFWLLPLCCFFYLLVQAYMYWPLLLLTFALSSTLIAFHPLLENSRSWIFGSIIYTDHCNHRFSFFLSFFYAHCFLPTLGILRKLKFCFPSYFCIGKPSINKKSKGWDIVPTSADPPPLETWDALTVFIFIAYLGSTGFETHLV